MKKEILLPALAWLGGIGGFALRRWELAAAYDPELRVMSLDCPVTWLLCALTVMLLGVFALSCWGMDREKREPRQWFYAPSSTYIMLVVCAAMVLMLGGLLGLWEQSGLYGRDMILLVTYVLCLLSGVMILMAGKKIYRGGWSQDVPLMFMAPSFATLVWLVAAYQQHARQPVVRLYMWHMLAAVAVVLALYGMVTVALGKGSPARLCVTALMGISLSLTTLADGHGLVFNLIYLFALVYLTAQSYMLLRTAFGTPWPERMPRGAELDKTDETHTEE